MKQAHLALLPPQAAWLCNLSYLCNRPFPGHSCKHRSPAAAKGLSSSSHSPTSQTLPITEKDICPAIKAQAENMGQQDGDAPSEQELELQRQPTRRQRVELYAEENFVGANLKRSVHIGWGVCLGGLAIITCFGMSAFTQGASWNVSFRWLQRRVGFQFGTLTYLITSNTLFYFDGDKWVTRDWAESLAKFSRAGAPHPAPLAAAGTNNSVPGGISHGFAADAIKA